MIPFPYDPEISQKLILKITGTACNISCRYCFEKRKKLDFNKFMHPAILNDFLAKINKPVEIVLHGGEPLLSGFYIFNEILSVIKHNRKKILSVFLQTNGTLLDDKWIDVLFNKNKELNIQIAISLDGTPEMNKLRVTYKGEPTYDKVINSFNLLSSIGKKAGLLSVIGRHALNKADEYVKMLIGIPNLLFVKINPLFDSIPGMLCNDSITPSEFTKFLKQVTIAYINYRGFLLFPIEPILSLIQKVKGVDSKYCNFNRRKCLNFTTLYPDGRIGICDSFSLEDFPIIIDNDIGFKKILNNYVMLRSNISKL